MAAYAIRRLMGLIPILVGISIIVFLIMRMLPGDVATMILMGGSGGDTVTSVDPKAVAELRHQLGLDLPLYQQYFSWVIGLLHLDAGTSLWTQHPVFEEIGNRLPLTLELATMGLAISLVIAIPVGIVSALKQNTWVDYLFRSVSIAGLALPSFWLATLMILALTIWFNWTPPLGYVSFTDDPWVNMQQLLLPAIVIGYSNAAVIARMTRSAMLEVMREDYVRTAWAKGLNLRAVLSVHALRNAMLPILTLAAIELGHLMGGTVVMENIFTLPGLGRYLIDAIFHRDFPVVQTIVLLMGALFVLLNLAVDLLYGVLDPRIRYS
jgi:peptide/nickel transport system permease protein